jgi:hypothetical protein
VDRRAGTRILLEVPEGLPPLRVVRFDTLGVLVLDGKRPSTPALSCSRIPTEPSR